MGNAYGLMVVNDSVPTVRWMRFGLWLRVTSMVLTGATMIRVSSFSSCASMLV